MDHKQEWRDKKNYIESKMIMLVNLLNIFGF
jgi:hypothetical protein